MLGCLGFHFKEDSGCRSVDSPNNRTHQDLMWDEGDKGISADWSNNRAHQDLIWDKGDKGISVHSPRGPRGTWIT